MKEDKFNIICADVIHKNYKIARKKFLRKCKCAYIMEILIEILVMGVLAFVFIMFILAMLVW